MVNVVTEVSSGNACTLQHELFTLVLSEHQVFEWFDGVSWKRSVFVQRLCFGHINSQTPGGAWLLIVDLNVECEPFWLEYMTRLGFID